MKFLFLLSLPMLLIYCNTAQRGVNSKEVDQPKTLIIENLICHKLSEKLAGFGSVNDEILLAVYFVDINGSMTLNWHSEILLVGEEGEKIELAQKLSLPTGDEIAQIKIALLEQDTERSVEEMLQLLSAELAVTNAIDALRKALRDDDFLGLQGLNLTEGLGAGELKFWGMQLFDEYDYDLTFRLQ